MQPAQIQSSKTKEQLRNRLRRIEGQVRGVQQMLDEDRDCHEIMQQLNAAMAAMHKASHQLARAYAKECVLNVDALAVREREEAIDALLDLMVKVR